MQLTDGFEFTAGSLVDQLMHAGGKLGHSYFASIVRNGNLFPTRLQEDSCEILGSSGPPVGIPGLSFGKTGSFRRFTISDLRTVTAVSHGRSLGLLPAHQTTYRTACVLPCLRC